MTPAGFEQFVETALPGLTRFGSAVAGQRADAEDAVQTSLVRAMGAWSRVADQEHWRQQAYVRAIVVNTHRSAWRRWAARTSLGEVPECSESGATDAVEDRMLVRRALAQLKPRQQMVLYLRYFEDLSEAEIAARLGMAPGTVKSTAARGLAVLRQMLNGPSTVAEVHARAEVVDLRHGPEPKPVLVDVVDLRDGPEPEPVLVEATMAIPA